MTPISERQSAGFNIYKKQKNAKYLYIEREKTGHCVKIKIIYYLQGDEFIHHLVSSVYYCYFS